MRRYDGGLDGLLLRYNRVQAFRQIDKPYINYEILAWYNVRTTRDLTHFGLWYQETSLSFLQTPGYKMH